MRRLLTLVSFFALAAAPSIAQDKPVDVNLGGGVTFPVGNLADTFDTGWNGVVGVTFNINETVGIEADYQYHRLNGPDRTFPGVGTGPVLIESNHQMHAGSFNFVVRSRGSGAVGAYLLGGPGVYHRIIQLTTPSVGVATVCDPYWFVCYPVAVETDQIVGDRSSTDFGVNVGGGVTFGSAAKFYVEARYHYVWGPKFELPDGTSFSSNAQYFPITFGFRF